MRLENIPSPCYVCDEELLENNLKDLAFIKKEAGVKILLALKGFSMWATFDLVGDYLDGISAGGLYEAKLGQEEMKKEVHTYSPAFTVNTIDEIASISDHLIFNSYNQFNALARRAKQINSNISIGIRVNPEISVSPVEHYNPCGLYSRLGVTKENFEFYFNDFSLIDGLHFHALCEQNADALKIVLESFEAKFSIYFKYLKWVNFGGGHHITRKDYNKKTLITILKDFKQRYPHLEIYLEPSEAIAWEAGILVASVVDIIHNDIDIAILNISAEAHMPDTLLMPYRANIKGSGKSKEKAYTYRIGGNTCLAGDIMGDYSFDNPLSIGQKLIFEDQIHYTFVKNTTFNGVELPSLALWTKEKNFKLIRSFGYDDFKNRLS